MLIDDKSQGLNYALMQVNQFHEKFGVEVSEFPTMMDEQTTINRYKFSKEENDELLQADNIYQQVDSALDRIYLALGDLSIMGVTNVQALFDMVQESNMGKVWPDGKVHLDAETGKIIKSPDWAEKWDHEPRLIAEIDRQIEMSRYAVGIDLAGGEDKTVIPWKVVPKPLNESEVTEYIDRLHSNNGRWDK